MLSSTTNAKLKSSAKNLYLIICKFSLFSSSLRKTAKFIHKIRKKHPVVSVVTFIFSATPHAIMPLTGKVALLEFWVLYFPIMSTFWSSLLWHRAFSLKGPATFYTHSLIFLPASRFAPAPDSHKCTDSPAAPPQMSQGSGENKNTAVKSA